MEWQTPRPEGMISQPFKVLNPIIPTTQTAWHFEHCSLIVNLRMFPDVLLHDPHPETGVVGAPASSLTWASPS